MKIFELGRRERKKEANRHNKEFARLLDHVDNCYDFIETFSDLQFGRSFQITANGILFDPNVIIMSAYKTLDSIHACCELANFSDAHILIRRYREDLFFYLFIIVYGDEMLREHSNVNVKSTNETKIIEEWLDGTVQGVNFTLHILKYIGNSTVLKKVVDRYDLQESLEKIGTQLNNYVHWNGRAYYNYHGGFPTNTDINEKIDSMIKLLDEITVTFVFLLFIIKPGLVMSSDYTDYMDMGVTPPKDSEYFVAPFIEDYLKNNSKRLGKDIIEYLRKMTSMEI